MAGVVMYVPPVSLLALRLARPERFYAQDWYLTEPFARATHHGEYDPERVPAPAVVAVWAMLESLRCGLIPRRRYVTTDVDGERHPVYVVWGKGIEVHRNIEVVCAS